MTAKKDNNLLDNLFKEHQEISSPDMEELYNLIYRGVSRSNNIANKKPRKLLTNQYKNKQKIKEKKDNSKRVSAVELGKKRARIKVVVPKKLKSKVSMSRLVDIALNAILKEFDEK